MATEFYDDDGAPIKCKHCRSTSIEEKATDAIDLIETERDCVCSGCGALIGAWAYGVYDSHFMENEHDMTRLEPRNAAIRLTELAIGCTVSAFNRMKVGF